MEQRFLEKVMPEPNSGCWFWTGSLDENGYGFFRVDRKMARAHRVSFELFCQPIPEGLNVLHSCDTPCCVNPDHLRLGTHSDNMKDRSARKRAPHLHRPGSKNGQAKLNEDQVCEIRKLALAGETDTKIASKFNVSRRAICGIRSGKTWRHVA